jgi:uncharacterized protein (TIGR00251 family)
MSTTRLRLRVTPGARRSGIVGRYGEAWKVTVAAPPEDGRANAALVALLADTLDVPRGSVTLVSGHGTRDKVVELAGLAPDRVAERLALSSGKDTHR